MQPPLEQCSMEKPLQLTERPFIWRTELRFTSGTNYLQLLFLRKQPPKPPPFFCVHPPLLSSSSFSLHPPPWPAPTSLYGSILLSPSFLLLPRWHLILQLTLLFLPVSLSICFHSFLLHPFLPAYLTFYIFSPNFPIFGKFSPPHSSYNLLLPPWLPLSAPPLMFLFLLPPLVFIFLFPATLAPTASHQVPPVSFFFFFPLFT